VSAGKGKKSKTFMIHSSFATKSSKYMHSALKDDWKEGQEKHFSLVDHEPEALEGYINWLYTKEVTLKDAEQKCKLHGPAYSLENPNSNCSYLHYLKLIKMYILGDYMNDMRFCNAVVDAMRLMRSCYPSPDAVQWAWNHTMQDSPVRKHLLEMWAEILGHPNTPGHMKGNLSKLSKEFLVDLLTFTGSDHRAEILKCSTARRTKSERCELHRHVDDWDKCN
jgi:hypothetical protein